jgi:hypothetical protein
LATTRYIASYSAMNCRRLIESMGGAARAKW